MAKKTKSRKTAAKPAAKSAKAAPKESATKPGAAKPTAAKPTAAKPTAAKPTAAKPSAAKPTAAKPAKAKPIAETTPRMAKQLSDAAAGGKLAEVVALLERGCDPNVLHKDSSALAWAAYKGHVDIVEALLARGADPNLGKSYPSAGGAMHAAASRGAVEILELLVAAGGDVNVCGQKDDSRPLFNALDNAHVDATRFLLDRGADPHFAPGGRTAMLAAASGGSTAILDLLHARGASLDGARRPLLHQAVRSNKPEAVAWLLRHGCDPNEYEGEETALHVAADLDEGGVSLIDALIAGGAKLEARTDGDESATPLQVAVHNGHPDNVARLLHHGADRTAPTNIPDWPTLLDMAKHHLEAHPPEDWGDNYVRIVKLLES